MTHEGSGSCIPQGGREKSRSGSQIYGTSVREGSSAFILTPKGILGGWHRISSRGSGPARAEESQVSFIRGMSCSCNYH